MTVLTGVEAAVEIPKQQYEVARGDNVTLPCTFKSTTNNAPALIEWSSQVDANAEEVRLLCVSVSVYIICFLGYLTNSDIH